MISKSVQGDISVGVIKITRLEAKYINDIKVIEQELGLSSWTRADYLREIPRTDSICLAAIYKGKAIGFIVARLIMSSGIVTSTLQNSEKFPHQCEIYNIGVSERFQKRGIASQLLNSLMEKIDKQRQTEIWLEVRKSNRQAIKFYTAKGFTKKYERKNFYRNPIEDGLVLSLNSDAKEIL